MNILFFLTPKKDLVVVEEDETLRQVVEKMEKHGYSAVPLIGKNGRYLGTVTQGDILWDLHKRSYPSMKKMESIPIQSINRRRDNKAVHIAADMEGLVQRALNQNFVPVVDDDKIFIGIVTRKDLIGYLAGNCDALTAQQSVAK